MGHYVVLIVNVIGRVYVRGIYCIILIPFFSFRTGVAVVLWCGIPILFIKIYFIRLKGENSLLIVIVLENIVPLFIQRTSVQ